LEYVGIAAYMDMLLCEKPNRSNRIIHRIFPRWGRCWGLKGKDQRMDIITELKALAGNYDIGAMDALVEGLSPIQFEANKPGIIDAYEMVYAYGLYDLDCNKVSDPEGFIFYLLDVIASIQRFFPDQMYFKERGYCYQNLSERAVVHDDKVRHINEAIRVFNIAPQTTDIQMAMVGVLTDKMEITKQFTTAAFTELLSFYRPVLADPDFVSALIHLCFRVRALPVGQHHSWYQRMLGEFELAMHELAENSPLVYLEWAETYHYILYHDSPEIEPEYKTIMVAQTATLLQPLEGYYTENAELLNRLGKTFADTAQRSKDSHLQLDYYRISVDFFTKGHEHGLQLFARVYKHEDDFQLNLYWGDFLLEYAGLAYGYKSSSINRLAEEKLQRSAVLGRNYYSHPYFSMARLAIRSGDKEKCVKLLLQCRDAVRSTGYDAYDLSEAIEDDDFREIRNQLF
jgi:hypothetical protein